MAKRRRINLKFLVISALVLVGLGGTALVLRRTVFRPNPEKYITLGKADMARGDWEQAVKDIGSAIRYSRGPDPTTWILLAQALEHRTGEDFNEITKQWIGAVNTALSIDPSNKTALRMMMDYQMDRIQFAGLHSASEYDSMARFTDKLLAVDPQDKRAQYLSAFIVLDQKMAGAISVDPKRVTDAENKLLAILKADPADADAAFLLARWRVTQLIDSHRLGNAKDARDRFAELEKFVTATLAAGKDSPLVHQRMGQVLLAMGDIWPTLNTKATTQQADSMLSADFKKQSPEFQQTQRQRLALQHRAFEEFEIASKAVKPTDEHYVEIQQFYAKQLERPIGLVNVEMPKEEVEKTVKEAVKRSEAISREVLAQAPGEQRVKIMLAKMIARDPSRREEAIKLLDEPAKPNPKWIGMQGFLVKQTQMETLLTVCDMRLDLVETKSDKDQREALLKQVQSDYDKLVAQAGESFAPALVVKGRLQFFHNDMVGATQTFTRALSAYQSASEDRNDLEYQLARTFMATNQTGEAKKLLRDVIGFNPADYRARLQLAELLLKEGNIRGNAPRYDDGAVYQLDLVERFLPADHPALVRLRLMCIDRTKEPEKFKAQWAKIPEGTPAEKFEKARLAAAINEKDESIRLLEALRAEQPAAGVVVQALVQAYVEKGQKDKALAVAQEAAAKNPNEPGFKMLVSSLVDPSQTMKMRLDEAQKVQDPLRRALALVDYYRDSGEEDKMMEQLLAAEKIAPDNGRIMAALFEIYVSQKQWDKAQPYLDKLAKRNEDSADGQTFRIQFALAQAKLDQALEQALKLTKTHAAFAQTWVLLGKTYQAQSKYDEAIAAYQQALERQTENVDAIRGLIDTYYALNQPGKPGNDLAGQKATGARAYIELGQKRFPYSQLFKELALRWEMAYGDPEKAIAPRALAVKEHPDNPAVWFDLAIAYLAAAEPKSGAQAGNTDVAATIDPKLEAQRRDYRVKGRDTLAQAYAKFPNENRFANYLIDADLQLKEIDQAEKVLNTMVDRPEYKGKPEAFLTRADFYQRANKPDKAEQVLQEGLKAIPDHIGLQLRLADTLYKSGRVDEALKVLEANQDNDYVVRQRVEILVNAGRTDDASTFVNALLAKKPGYPFYIRLRANVDLAMGKYDDVYKAANQILAADSNDVDGLYLRGRARLADPHGDIAGAADDLFRVVALQPTASTARIQLAEAYWRRGMLNEAIRVLQETISLLPNDKTLRLKLLNLYATANPPRWYDAETLLKDSRQRPEFASDVNFVHAEALMWLQRKEPTRALDSIKSALAQEPDNLTFLRTYLAILADQKNFPVLFSESEKLVKAHPDIWWGLQYRAIARKGAQSDAKGALADLQAALQVALKNQDQAGFETCAKAIGTELGAPAAQQSLKSLQGLNPHWQLVVAGLLQQVGDPQSGLALVEKVLADPKISPNDLMDGLKIGGVMYMTTTPRNLSKAIELHRRLVKELPNDVGALNNLAYLLLEDGPTRNPTEAVQYSQRVVDLTRRQGVSDDLPLVLDTYAWALINSGQVEEGISQLRDALQKKQFAEGLYHLAQGYLKLKQPQLLEAQKALQDAQHLQDDDKRLGKPVDLDLKSKIDSTLDSVKQMKK